jgi:hypothetical protein
MEFPKKPRALVLRGGGIFLARLRTAPATALLERFMKRWHLPFALACLAIFAMGQSAPSGQSTTANTVRILEPQPGAKLTQDFIHVDFELANPNSVPGTPTFSVQLDNQPAVQTAEKSKEFTGLRSGIHNVSVWVVDANGTPIAGSQASVQFILLNPAQPPGAERVALQSAPPVPPNAPRSPDLPAGSSPLPLLSLIGLGVLFGGLMSAMKTR